MPDTHIECQGLPCPQPVLKCKGIIEAQRPDSISVVVDNEPARINVSRFLETNGYTVKSEGNASEFIISAKMSDDAQFEVGEVINAKEIKQAGTAKDLVFITSDTIGKGDDELGRKLMVNFVSTLKEMGADLWRIILVNGGVRLAVEDHACLEQLIQLEEKGTSILVCGTCLEHFDLTSQKRVGEVTNMLDVVTSLQLASKTIQV